MRGSQQSGRKRVAVIGLGRFGTSVALACHQLGYDVTALDISERRVAEAAEFATLAAQADGADKDALIALGVGRSDVGVVAQGQNIEASISCALVLKQIGVPWVIAKAETDLHGQILVKVGADRIVYPEKEAGIQVAHSLDIRHDVDYMNLTPTSGVARLAVPEHAVGKSLAHIEEHGEGVCVILIQRGNLLLPHPPLETTLERGDIVLLAGLDSGIDAFADW